MKKQCRVNTRLGGDGNVNEESNPYSSVVEPGATLPMPSAAVVIAVPVSSLRQQVYIGYYHHHDIYFSCSNQTSIILRDIEWHQP